MGLLFFILVLIKYILFELFFTIPKTVEKVTEDVMEELTQCTNTNTNIFENDFNTSNYKFFPQAPDESPSDIGFKIRYPPYEKFIYYQVEKKNLCPYYLNEADCWDNNYCQWSRDEVPNRCVEATVMLL